VGISVFPALPNTSHSNNNKGGRIRALREGRTLEKSKQILKLLGLLNKLGI
jgi:hypothetical protein